MVHRGSGQIFRFGPYEFDPNGHDLRKHGVRIRLQGQPLQLLAALLERPGEIVSRDELRNRLWPADTFVDFESGLNTAAKRLRTALSDSADQPVYVETVTRSGYRFIAPVSALPDTKLPDIPSLERLDVSRRRDWLGYSGVAALSSAATGGAVYWLSRREATPRWTFRQLSFRQGEVSGARYSPDGQSIVFAAQFEQTPKQIYLNNGVSPESRPLNLEGFSLAAVSRRGELALSRNSGTSPIRGGTLEKVPMNGGTPTVADHDIMSADWMPDGAGLAIIRAAGGVTQLEYPAGRPLHRTPGWLSSLRVSPNGNFFALIEHPIRHDDAGMVRILDRQGRRIGETPSWDVAGGVAWRSNEEIWFSASRGNAPKSLWRCDLAGRVRPLLTGPGVLTLSDVQPDGRALILRQSRRLEMTASLQGAPQQDLSGHDWSRVADLSSDGRLILFDETGEAVGASRATYLFDSASGGTRRLADGQGLCLSPDARHTLMVRREDRHRILRVPIDGGSLADWTANGLEYQWARYYPDGQHLFALASERAGGLRVFRVGLDGRYVPLTPPGMVRHAALSRDGKQLAVLAANGKLLIYPAQQPGSPVEVPISNPMGPILWQADHRHLYTQALDQYTQVPAPVFVVDTVTGKTTLWRNVKPFDPVGVNSITRVMISTDERSWVSSYRRVRSELFQITPQVV